MSRRLMVDTYFATASDLKFARRRLFVTWHWHRYFVETKLNYSGNSCSIVLA